jgi:hypothetical protein
MLYVIRKVSKLTSGPVSLEMNRLACAGSLIIECFRKQQSLNLVALKDINGISIYASPHRTLNNSSGIIRYIFLLFSKTFNDQTTRSQFRYILHLSCTT